ncbi:MAG: hypothetical protein K1000chlam2_01691 [Chlamydiae bacterium]|nr:hypothetical protein [Chlamydiota bacterium]
MKLKKTILILTTLSLTAGGVLGYHFIDSKRQADVSQAYTSNDERFDAEFPSEPKESSEEMEVANKKIEYHQLSTEEGDSTYAVSYIDFPGYWKMLGTKKLLTKSFDAFVENEKNVEEVLDKQFDSHDGYLALIYRLKQNGKEIKGKFLIVGNTLYRITVTYPLAAAEKIHPNAFLDSFKIKK